MKKNIIFLFAAITMLLSVLDAPYYSIQLLRLFVCGVAVYGFLLACKKNQKKWMGIFAFIVLIYNPFIPIELEDEAWVFIDCICGLSLFVYFYKAVELKKAVCKRLKKIKRRTIVFIIVFSVVTISLVVVRNAIIVNFTSFVKKATPWQVSLAIVLGAEVNYNERYYGKDCKCPLVCAAKYNKNPEVIKILIKRGASLRAQSLGYYLGSYSESPLGVAAEYNTNPEVISTLIEYGEEVNSYLFGIAIYNPFFLCEGAGMSISPDFKNSTTSVSWGTLLMLAVKYNANPEVVKRLVALGADVNAKDEAGLTPLMHLANGYNVNLELINFLIESGANIDDKDNEGHTMFEYLACNPKVESIKEFSHFER